MTDSQKIIEMLRVELKKANQRYNRICNTAGRYRKTLEFYKQGFIDAGARATEALKRRTHEQSLQEDQEANHPQDCEDATGAV